MQILQITLVRRELHIKGVNVKKNNNQGRFFRELSAHVRKCHDFPLPEVDQTTFL